MLGASSTGDCPDGDDRSGRNKREELRLCTTIENRCETKSDIGEPDQQHREKRPPMRSGRGGSHQHDSARGKHREAAEVPTHGDARDGVRVDSCRQKSVRDGGPSQERMGEGQQNAERATQDD